MKRILGIVLVLSLIIGIQVPAHANTNSENVRIGLTTSFSGQSKITVNSNAIGIGYSKNQVFTQLEQLTSDSGFALTPVTGYFYISTNTYSSLSEANNVVATLNKISDVTAYPSLVGVNRWKVYLGGNTTQAKTTAMYNAVKVLAVPTFDSKIVTANKHTVLLAGSATSMLYDGQESSMYPQLVGAKNNAKGVKTLTLNKSEYRGRIEIGTYGQSTLTAVSVLPMDEYLYGVIPAEMPTSWPAEALKAQAAVARTYALNKGGGYSADSNIAKGYVLNDTTSSQVYKGYGVEAEAGNKAVDATSGKLIYHNDKIIDATFYSTSGGATENSENVWGSPVAYLKGVPDLYETSPEKGPWLVTMTGGQLKSKLDARSLSTGTINDITVNSVTKAGFVEKLSIQGSSKSVTLDQQLPRSYFSLFSNKFKIIKKGDTPDKVSTIKGDGSTTNKRISSSYIISGDGTTKKASESLEQYITIGSTRFSNYPRLTPTAADTYIFAGMGFGHGVGLSQSGARGMANAGFTYDEIIKHYYTDVTVK